MMANEGFESTRDNFGKFLIKLYRQHVSLLFIETFLNETCKQPLMMADERSKSAQDNFGKFIHQFQPETKTLIRKLERILIKLYIYIYIHIKLATGVESDPKALFSLATVLKCRRRRYSVPWISPLYP